MIDETKALEPVSAPTNPDTKNSVPEHTLGPWEYIASTEHHGPYVVGSWGGDICDCYTMSNLSGLSVRNGGDSRPIHFQHEHADANARLIAAAPELLDELIALKKWASAFGAFRDDLGQGVENHVNDLIAKATGRTPHD